MDAGGSASARRWRAGWLWRESTPRAGRGARDGRAGCGGVGRRRGRGAPEVGRFAALPDSGAGAWEAQQPTHPPRPPPCPPAPSNPAQPRPPPNVRTPSPAPPHALPPSGLRPFETAALRPPQGWRWMGCGPDQSFETAASRPPQAYRWMGGRPFERTALRPPQGIGGWAEGCRHGVMVPTPISAPATERALTLSKGRTLPLHRPALRSPRSGRLEGRGDPCRAATRLSVPPLRPAAFRAAGGRRVAAAGGRQGATLGFPPQPFRSRVAVR